MRATRRLPFPAGSPVSKPLAMRHTILANSHVIVALFRDSQQQLSCESRQLLFARNR